MHAGVSRSSNAHSRTCVALTSASTATLSVSARSRDPFAPLLRPSYESLEAEASTIPAIEPRYQTTFLGPDARVVCTSCCCKKAAADTADCHRKGDGVAPRAAAPSYSSRLLAAALIVARGSPYFGRCALRTALPNGSRGEFAHPATPSNRRRCIRSTASTARGHLRIGARGTADGRRYAPQP